MCSAGWLVPSARGGDTCDRVLRSQPPPALYYGDAVAQVRTSPLRPPVPPFSSSMGRLHWAPSPGAQASAITERTVCRWVFSFEATFTNGVGASPVTNVCTVHPEPPQLGEHCPSRKFPPPPLLSPITEGWARVTLSHRAVGLRTLQGRAMVTCHRASGVPCVGLLMPGSPPAVTVQSPC